MKEEKLDAAAILQITCAAPPLFKSPSALPSVTSASNQDRRSRRQVGTPLLLQRRRVAVSSGPEKNRKRQRGVEGAIKKNVYSHTNSSNPRLYLFGIKRAPSALPKMPLRSALTFQFAPRGRPVCGTGKGLVSFFRVPAGCMGVGTWS